MSSMARAMALGSLAFLHGCGGGSTDVDPVVVPLPLAPVQITLDAANYQDSARKALEWSDAAFSFAKLGADMADRLMRTSAALPPIFRCAVSGTASITLTDRNRNGLLNAGDTLSLFMEQCVTDFVGVTGVVRVEVTSAEPLGDGRAYQLLVTVANLSMTSSSYVDVPPTDVNLTASLDFSYTTDFDHYVLTFGEFRQTLAGQTQSVSNLVIDYLQRYDTRSYDYLLQGTLGSLGNNGEFRVATPMSFTGTIGSYPIAGRLGLSGAANSTARVSEEGAAASNSAAVLVSVDANGDGVAESEIPQLDWTQLLPAATFNSLRARPSQGLLPIP
jgi:hypothetical protein